MFYGIEQSTDLRDRRTRIAKFKERSKAVAWLRAGTLAFTHTDPAAARNFHRNLRTVVEMPRRWPQPSNTKLAQLAREASTPTYPRSSLDVLASLLHKDGTHVEID